MNNERNEDFICPCCQQVTFFPPSILTMHGNYGSVQHGTEYATVKLCGECFDSLYEIIQNKLPDEAIKTEFIL